jgi:hypothetical protein
VESMEWVDSTPIPYGFHMEYTGECKDLCTCLPTTEPLDPEDPLPIIPLLFIIITSCHSAHPRAFLYMYLC